VYAIGYFANESADSLQNHTENAAPAAEAHGETGHSAEKNLMPRN
jgi:F-type H+-transporting ATPase subunit a